MEVIHFWIMNIGDLENINNRRAAIKRPRPFVYDGLPHGSTSLYINFISPQNWQQDNKAN